MTEYFKINFNGSVVGRVTRYARLLERREKFVSYMRVNLYGEDHWGWDGHQEVILVSPSEVVEKLMEMDLHYGVLVPKGRAKRSVSLQSKEG